MLSARVNIRMFDHLRRQARYRRRRRRRQQRRRQRRRVERGGKRERLVNLVDFEQVVRLFGTLFGAQGVPAHRSGNYRIRHMLSSSVSNYVQFPRWETEELGRQIPLCLYSTQNKVCPLQPTDSHKSCQTRKTSSRPAKSFAMVIQAAALLLDLC